MSFINYAVSIAFAVGLGLATYFLSRRRPVSSCPYSQSNYESQYCSTCCICLMEFKSLELKNLVELPCKHRFHTDCITPIIEKEKQKKCPYCRAEIPQYFLDKFE